MKIDAIIDSVKYNDVKLLLKNSRIFFDVLENSKYRMHDDTIIFFSDDLCLESYSSFLAGETLCSMGSFSYSWSFLPSFVQVGRYCSIAGGLKILGTKNRGQVLGITIDLSLS